MKVLFSCPITQRVLSRFLKTNAFQEKYFPEAVAKCDRIIFTDENVSPVPGWSAVFAPIKINGVYNMARARNVIFEYAMLNEYDWIIDSDADRVLLNFPDRLTDPGLGAIPTHYGREGISDEDMAAQHKENLLDFSGGSSFFVIHKSVFQFFRNCEKFLGAGYEDLDFVFNVCQPAGVKSVTIHSKAIHRFHPQSERYPEYGGFNKQLYNERRIRLKGLGRPL